MITKRGVELLLKNKFTFQFLCALAVTALLLTFFPAAVMFAGFGMGRYVFWHFCVVYLIWGAFFAFGHQSSRLSKRFVDNASKKVKPFLVFITRIAVILPAVIFVIIAYFGRLDPAVYIYVLTASIGAFVGGYMTYGKSFTDIYSTGWFVIFAVLSIFSAMLFSTSKDKMISETGNTLLCIGFGVVIVLAAVLANQTNIEVCTRQRASSKQVLPSGLRRYNAFLVIGICAVLIGLFVFARPLTSLLRFIMSWTARGISHLFNDVCVGKPQDIPQDSDVDDDGDNIVLEPQEYEDFGKIIFAAVIVILILIIIILRRQIMSFIKSAFSPLIKKDDSDVPFVDEVTTSDKRSMTPRDRRKAERVLFKRYRKTKDPGKKYRLGYALFLLRLSGTEKASKPSDTAKVQRIKGEEQYKTDLGEFSEVYGRLRYGDIIPNDEELIYEEELLDNLK